MTFIIFLIQKYLFVPTGQRGRLPEDSLLFMESCPWGVSHNCGREAGESQHHQGPGGTGPCPLCPVSAACVIGNHRFKPSLNSKAVGSSWAGSQDTEGSALLVEAPCLHNLPDTFSSWCIFSLKKCFSTARFKFLHWNELLSSYQSIVFPLDSHVFQHCPSPQPLFSRARKRSRAWGRDRCALGLIRS